MAKNKTRTKKRKKTLDRRLARKAAVPNPEASSNRVEARKRKGLRGIDRFTQDELIFWFAHGVNYLASDYKEGIWNPVFPELYEGKLPDVESLTQGVMGRIQDEKEANAALFGWTMQPKSSVYIYRREALRSLKEAEPDCEANKRVLEPKVPAVWEVFAAIQDQVLGRPE